MIRWPAPAKLNLFLYITGRRPDQYHNLQTLFQFIDYADYLTFMPRSDEQINLVTPVNNVPDNKNLIVIAATLLQSYVRKQGITVYQPLGVDIAIDKKLPMGGGMGGASSNAATTLVALNHIWKTGLSSEQLMNLGRRIGADVPIFIHGYSAFAEGVGDQFQPVDIPEKWYLVVRPDVEISTVKVFTDHDLKRDTVTKSVTEALLLPFANDCEPLVRKRYPQVDSIISLLSQYAPARLTGTGACVFAEFDDETSALATQQQLPIDIVSFVAKGLNTSPLLTITNNLGA